MSDDINRVSNRVGGPNFHRRIKHAFLAHLVSDFSTALGTSSRDVSDPQTDPGVRVRGPEVGSLTSRLLSATLCAAAEAAAASFSGRRDSLSTNCHSVIGCAHARRSRIGPDRSEA
jgi:hypothetical protein